MTYAPCPGWYCGRHALPNGTLSACGACPRGTRRNDTTFVCEPCSDPPLFYDWLYLGFMALLVVALHWFFIDMVAKGKSCAKEALALHFCALTEVAVAGVAAVLLASPAGEWGIRSCRAGALADWYTLLHNPTPNYERKVYCTQEAVYPL